MLKDCVSTAFRIPHPLFISVAASAVALVVWYGSGLLNFDRAKRDNARKQLAEEEQKQKGESDLSNRIKKVLIECRMALPGAQAFLGFQFSIVFAEVFDKLPRSSQWVHFGSLLATTVAIVLLIAPAAYHSLAEAGEETEHFHSVASGLLLVALVFLTPGISGDLLVVVRKVTGSLTLSCALSGGCWLRSMYCGLGVSYLRRKRA